MPRVSSLDSQAKKEKEVHAVIEHQMIVLDKTDEALAQYLDIHLKTFKRKKKHPGQFTLLEMQRLSKYLNFGEREKVTCL